MGVSVRILTSVDEYDKKRINSGDTLGFVEDLKSEILEYHYREIEYFSDFVPEASAESDAFILGETQPEKLLRIASGWNADIWSNAVKTTNKLEAIAKERGFKSISELIEGESAHELYKIYELASLGKAFYALQNTWQYGEYHMVFSADKGLNERAGDYNYYGNGTLIGDNLLKDIKAHPEDYLTIDLIIQ